MLLELLSFLVQLESESVSNRSAPDLWDCGVQYFRINHSIFDPHQETINSNHNCQLFYFSYKTLSLEILVKFSSLLTCWDLVLDMWWNVDLPLPCLLYLSDTKLLYLSDSKYNRMSRGPRVGERATISVTLWGLRGREGATTGVRLICNLHKTE